MSTDVTFFETTPFSLSPPVTSQVEDHAALTPTPIPIKPPTTQVYSQHQNPPDSSLTLAASSSDPVQNHDLPIALHKGKR